MEINIYELLQQETVNKSINKVIIYLKRNENVANLNLLMLQFFVNALKRKIEITNDDLEEIESTEDLQEFLLAIFLSLEDEEEAEVAENVRDFIQLFIGEAFAANLLSDEEINSWIKWLEIIATHKEIPDNKLFKQSARYLSSLLLIPFARLLEVIPENIAGSSDDLRKAISSSLSVVLKLISSGFKYNTLCVDISKQVVDTVENHFEVFGDELQVVLRLYKDMMLVESHALHVMALKSLVKLCGIEVFREPLKEFFNEQGAAGETDELKDDLSFSNILLEFIGRKNLRVEVMLLLKAMKDLEAGEIISEEMKVELYMTIFSGNKKLVAETIALMSAFGDDFWMQIINLLNYHVTEVVDYSKLFEILSSIEGFSCNSKDLFRITIGKLDTPEVAHRAVIIAMEVLEHDVIQQEEVLQVIDKVLEGSMRDEKTFTLLLRCINVVNIETFSKFLKENTVNLLSITDTLLKAFVHFNTSVTLHNIVAVLKKTTKIAPEYTLGEVRKVFKQSYLGLMQADDQFSADPENTKLSIYKKPITKISALLENKNWNLMNESAMKIIFALCQRLFPIASVEDEEMLPIMVRLLTNFFKHIWTRVALNKPIPFKTHQVLKPLEAFYKTCEAFIFEAETDIEAGHLILISVMDILLLFQPSMKEKSSHEMFNTGSFVLKKQGVVAIAASIEKLVFPKSAEEKSLNDATFFQCEFILETWIAFCKNYEALPSLTASEKIIRHYSLKHPLKAHLESLMDHLLTKKNIFEQTVAFVTLNLSNQNDLAKFRQFHHALEIFLSQKFSDIKSKLMILGTICSYVLSKLDIQINSIRYKEGIDRLMVLDYVVLFTKNLSAAMKQTLDSYIPIDPEKDNLSEPEKEHLIAFKAQLIQ